MKVLVGMRGFAFSISQIVFGIVREEEVASYKTNGKLSLVISSDNFV